MSLKDFQEDFTNCCRGKDDSPLKEEKRIGVYKQFIYEKMEESLENAYPITLSLISKEVWKDMIVSFIREYPCDTPYYWRIPEQFCFFAQKKKLAQRYNIPYLEDLLVFEWAEIEVYMMKDGIRPEISKTGNVLEDLLYLNPDHLLHHFQYQVFHKGPGIKKDCHVITYRHYVTKQVHYLQISRFYRIVLELLRERPLSGMGVLEYVAPLFNLDLDVNVISHANQFFKDLQELGVIEGFIK